MRIMKSIVLAAWTVLAACNVSQATIISVEYTGTYSGTVMTYNGITFTTTTIGPTPFDLTLVFNTLTSGAAYTDTPNSSSLTSFSFSPSVGFATGSFFSSGTIFASDTASTGTTSQSLVDRTISKVISNSPALFMTVNHPDIPGSITQPFSISNGLSGSGSYSFTYVGNFSGFDVQYRLDPQTIEVTIAGVPEPQHGRCC